MPILLAVSPVGGDAIGTHNHGLNAAGLHQVGAHVVAENSGWNVVLHQLPRGESRALEVGSCLIGEDINGVPALNRRADDAESGAVAARGERTGVAVGEDGPVLRQQVCPKGTELFAGSDIFVVHAAREGNNGGLDLGDRRAPQRQADCRDREPCQCPKKD